ncbi:MAG: hypothetical protein FWD42_05255, partial [Solirubrobacterales bacterium]|nr:hypothetical protein [Solirubrobacterales bacterium]
PAFSQVGRYVVFRGSLAGAYGVYRRDLQSGRVVMVAGASRAEVHASISESAIGAPDAAGPSVSADGRYVAFTSAAVLDPEDDTGSGCPQVYVRDMDLPASQPGAYTLVSALNGESTGLKYAARCPPSSPRELAIGGAQAASGVAISADGDRVVFTVLDRSNLTSEEKGEPTTPPRQVAVRDLAARTTTLVSATPAGQPVAGGGAYPSLESEPEGRILLEPPREQPTASSAAISADGSTVAWEGTNIPEQVPSATEVTAAMVRLGGPGKEVEPLWRRVADGSAAVTRRLLAGAGLNFYFFGYTDIENSGPVEAGALVMFGREFLPPALSADGRSVAVLADAPTKVGEEDYFNDPARQKNGTPVPPTDAYLLQVPDRASAPVQVRALTATPSFAAQNIREQGVGDIAISPDGSRVAFNTIRTYFALASPTLTSPPAEEVNYAYTYEVNVPLDTLQQVTSTYSGLPPNGNPTLLSFAGDGHSLALASTAANLFYGDGTPGASQVYLVHENPEPAQVAAQGTSPAPTAAPPQTPWTLSATGTAEPDGSVLLDAQVPGAGRLAARAGAQLPAASGPRLARGLRRRARGARAHRRGKAKPRSGGAVTVPLRTIAQGALAAGGPSELVLRLRASARYRALVNAGRGLYCILKVTFAAPGHAALDREIPVTMRRLARNGSRRRTVSPSTRPRGNA